MLTCRDEMASDGLRQSSNNNGALSYDDSLIHFLNTLKTIIDIGVSERRLPVVSSDIMATLILECNSKKLEPKFSPHVLKSDHHLVSALENARNSSKQFAELCRKFEDLMPLLHWYRRPTKKGDTEDFSLGHANTYIIGPSGLKSFSKVSVGFSLIAPGVTYPRHKHCQEEIYIVMSAGDWFNEDCGWYTPGLGALIYHRSNIIHAMRANSVPLIAFWVLWKS